MNLQAENTDSLNSRKTEQTALIIGAGPAGLCAAWELLEKTNIKPVVIEASDYLGGISKTVNYKGNRIDIGGHRFFSKSDKVMKWWESMMPLENPNDKQFGYLASTSEPVDADKTDGVMLIRSRKSRIYFNRKLFDYPISFNADTVKKLGFFNTFLYGLSYIKSTIFPVKPENTLEDFFINRFGKKLYLRFFKSYTEKVWGVPCNEINAEWGAQRIKGLSITGIIKHYFGHLTNKDTGKGQKNIETSLIERFLYPKYGPGQMWEIVAEKVREKGGQIIMNARVDAIRVDAKSESITEATYTDENGDTHAHNADYYFSTTSIRELIQMFDSKPDEIEQIAENLVYRDFLTVGLLVDQLKLLNASGEKIVSDNWIYIQEPDVRLGRLQIFNNWSPYMVSNPDKVWLGLEYFCNEGDDLWSMNDQDLIDFALKELVKIDIVASEKDFNDGVVIRQPKAYPAYFGSYDKFDQVKKHLDKIENLFLIGRNGMHRYNNQDHSMLAAMTAVENIRDNVKEKQNIWTVNTEKEYHESK